MPRLLHLNLDLRETHLPPITSSVFPVQYDKNIFKTWLSQLCITVYYTYLHTQAVSLKKIRLLNI